MVEQTPERIIRSHSVKWWPPLARGEGADRMEIFLDLAAGNTAAVVKAMQSEMPGLR